MIFVCDDCGRIFEFPYAPVPCPDCGSGAIRPASEAEQGEFYSDMTGTANNTDFTECFSPHFIETDLERVDCFKFKLPAEGLHINSKMILEIVVEYGISMQNKSVVGANVWARPVGGVLSGFLSTVQVPLRKGEESSELYARIATAVNDSDECMEQLCKFVTMLMNMKSE